MASRRRGSLPHLLTALALTGCTTAATTSSTGPDDAVPTVVTSTAVTTTTVPTTSTTSVSPLTTLGEDAEFDAEVRVPDGEGPFPAVVLVHGGAWVAGGPAGIRDLALYLTDEGFLTVNARYKLSADSPGFPQAIDDVACAVRYAAAHPDSNGTVTLLGHSAGAHIAAVVALTGDLYGETCPVAGSGIPDRFVGLAGVYDVTRLGFVILPFFGAGPEAAAEAWAAANPQGLVAKNPDLAGLLLIGDLDGLVDSSFGVDFAQALTQAGADALLEVVEGARHLDLVDPAVVGDLIVTWLER